MFYESKSTMITASTQIENQVVVTMNAQKTAKGDVNTNITIQSETLYRAYQAECDADIETFKTHVEEL